MRKVGLLLLSLLLVLGGCSVKSPFEGTEGFLQSSIESTDTLIQNCREWVRERDSMRWSQYEQLDPSAKVYALMHQETMDMIKTTFGKSGVDPCSPGTNVWDAYVAYAEQQGETSREAWKSGAKIITHGMTVGGIAYGVGQVMDAVGTTSHSTTTIGGSDNSVGRDKYDTRAFGEGGVNSTGSTSTVSEITSRTDGSYNTDNSGF